MDLTTSIITALAVVAIILAVVAIRAAKRSADKIESLQYSLSLAQEHGRERWQRVNDRVDGIEKGLVAGGAELGALGRAYQDLSRQYETYRQGDGRWMHKLHTLASHLGLYWDDDGRWSDSPYGGGAAVGMSQGVASGNQINAAKARGRRRT